MSNRQYQPILTAEKKAAGSIKYTHRTSMHTKQSKRTQSTVRISTDIFRTFVKLFPCCQKSMRAPNLIHMFWQLTVGKTLEK